MTDKELLELAAKAAGMPLDDGAFGLLDWWNPLTDDGDALRLAVKLKMFIETYGAGATVRGMHELANGDPYKATRRAIVRAAAEVGKNLDNQKPEQMNGNQWL